MSRQPSGKALDKGPPIDYSYRHPLDGSRVLPREQIDTYREPEVHDCDHPDNPNPTSTPG